MSAPSLLAEIMLRGLIVAAVGLSGSFLWVRSPEMRHRVLVYVLGGLVFMPLIVTLLPDWILYLPSVPVSPGSALSSKSILADTLPAPMIWRLVFGIWALGASVLLLRIATGLVSLERLRRTAVVSGELYGLRKTGETVVMVSSAVDVPVTLGLLRPMVLLPMESRAWPDQPRRAVLAHELSHVKRGDGWTLLLAALATALHWPNPFVWIVARQLRVASEEACDRAALATGISPVDYATVLVELAESASVRLCSLAPAACRARGLGGRLEHLLGAAYRRPSPLEGKFIAAALFTLTMVAGGVAPVAGDLPRQYATLYDIPAELSRRILKAARAERLEPSLAFGLVQVESAFDHGRSDGRGVGLTQILPSTAAMLEPGISRERLLEPDHNLRLGFRLLSSHVARFGDPERAVVAYGFSSRLAEEWRKGGPPALSDEGAEAKDRRRALAYAARVLDAAAAAKTP